MGNRIKQYEIKETGIYINLFGQSFLSPIYSPEIYSDKEWTRILGLKLQEMGKMIENTALYGSPTIIETPNNAKEITIGFNKEGRVIIPED